MASYVVTGASRGLGFGFLQALATNPSNIVVGLARDASALKTKLQRAGLTHVHAIEGDVGSTASMKAAAAAVSKITNGTLDVLINNAAIISALSAFKSVADFNDDQDALDKDFISSFGVNVLGLTHAVSAFIPLIKLGKTKKVVNISTGMTDIDLINGADVPFATPYTASKAAANVVIAKYNTVYGAGKEDILFLSISPGYVATEASVEAAQRDSEGTMAMGALFAKYAPDFKRPLTVEESVEAVLKVLATKTVENDGGKLMSHNGNQIWL